MTYTKIYSVFCALKKRCNNKNSKDYNRYWGRGIKCEWTSFEEFYTDMGGLYQDGLEIDRKDNDWNYCKDNCRWVTRKQNTRNTSKTIMYNWVPLIQICEERWLKLNTIVHRLYLWWNIDRALTLPIRKHTYAKK